MKKKSTDKAQEKYEKIVKNIEREGIEKLLTNEDVLVRVVNWQHLYKAQQISEQALKLLKEYDKSPPEIKEQLLDESGKEYAEIFLTILSQVSAVDVQQYLLALVDEMLKDEERIKLFLVVKDDDEDGFPFKPFVSLLHSSEDNFVTGKAVKILSTLLVETAEDCGEQAQEVVRWCLAHIKGNESDFEKIFVAISGLQVILRRDSFRPLFAEQNGTAFLALILERNMGKQQLLYQTIYCLWILTFNEKIAAKVHREEGLILRIVEIIRKKAKIKIRRIALATLKNILGKSKANNQQMIEAGFPRVLRYLNQQKWGDEDIDNDLKILTETLETEVDEMTSFDIYRKEIHSGNLQWSPVHKSEKFWKENIGRFEENNFEVISVLVNILKESKDPLQLSVACYDLGEFVRLHPRGRREISDKDGKKVIMMLMTHANEEVQKYALLCVQKMFVNNWEYLPTRGN